MNRSLRFKEGLYKAIGEPRERVDCIMSCPLPPYKYNVHEVFHLEYAQPAITGSNATIQTLEPGKICSKFMTKTPESRRRRSGIFIVNFEHISHLIFPWLTLSS